MIDLSQIIIKLIVQNIIKKWAVCCYNEPQPFAINISAPLYQSCQINRERDQMAIIQRAHRVVNKYILKIIKLVSYSIAEVGFIECGYNLLQKGVHNTPNKIALFAF